MSLTNVSNIFIMTLKATPNRKWGMIGALDVRDFPMDIVETIDGIDGLEYKTHDAIFKAAAADGFEFFADNPEYLERPIPMVAGSWSACRVLRHIVEKDETSILMEDDWVFTVDYRVVKERLQRLEKMRAADDLDEETLIAALISKTFSRGRIRKHFKIVDEYWMAGIPVSAACANVFTPKGAELCLTYFREHKASTLEKITRNIEYPIGVTMIEQIGRHPCFMGKSRANPSGTRKGFADDYKRWDKGYTL